MKTEAGRLAALARYRIMDTPSEADFDDIARIAAQICGVPIALVTMLDAERQWFKARVGTEETGTPRAIAFCAHAIEQEGVLEVPDLSQDERFADNPLVTGDLHVRFYAGAPIVTPDGFALGTVCVLDQQPHALNADQRDALAALARQVTSQLELRSTLAQRRADEARHRLIVDSAVDYAIVAMDLDGKVTSWNEGARRILGWTEQEMCGQRCDAFFTPEDRAAGVPDREMRAALEGGRAVDERWHVRESGERFWAAGEMMPLTDEHGAPVGLIKIVRDRTEQRLADERLEASEARFQLALGAAGFVGVWDWDVQADIVRSDARFARVWSVDPDAAEAGVPLARFVEGIHPDDRGRVADNIARCVAAGGEYAEEFRLLDAEGTVRWVSARGRCFHDDDGKPTSFPGVVIEITDRKDAEHALHDSETRVRLAIEAAELGTWEITPGGGELIWDPRTRVLMGHREGEAAGYRTSFLPRIHAEDRGQVEADVAAAFADGGSGRLDSQFRITGADGKLHWVNIHGRHIIAPGQPPRFVGTARDITEYKAAQEHRELLTEELQHRIKNTLTVVQAIVSQSLRAVATPAEASVAIGDRLATLARAHDLLTQTSWSAAPLKAVVSGALAVLGELKTRVHASGPEIRLQSRAALALAMVLHELCTNAAKFGALSVESGRVLLDWAAEGEGDAAVVRITWQEADGPPVEPPTRRGFGTRLVEASLARDLGGRGTLEYPRHGVRWTLIARRGSIEEI